MNELNTSLRRLSVKEYSALDIKLYQSYIKLKLFTIYSGGDGSNITFLQTLPTM